MHHTFYDLTQWFARLAHMMGMYTAAQGDSTLLTYADFLEKDITAFVRASEQYCREVPEAVDMAKLSRRAKAMLKHVSNAKHYIYSDGSRTHNNLTLKDIEKWKAHVMRLIGIMYVVEKGGEHFREYIRKSAAFILDRAQTLQEENYSSNSHDARRDHDLKALCSQMCRLLNRL